MPASGCMAIRALFFLGLVLLLGAIGGCRSATTPPEDSRPSKLAIYYGRYMSQHQGKSPPNEAEFKKFIKKTDAEANLDELFVSPRDKEPYVVRYDMKASMPGAMTITVHERTGVAGSRMISLSTGQVKTVDEAEFKELLSKSK